MVHGQYDVGTDVSRVGPPPPRRGSDLEDEQPSGDPSNSVGPSVFLKPSGVDEPQSLKDPSKPVDRDVNRDGPTKSSIKRGRDLASDLPLSEGKKKRKKKQQQE